MANVIKHKRGSGSDPSASDLIVGELAIRTDNGKLFTKMDSGSIAEIAGGGSDIAINTLSSSSATGGGSATFNGSAYRFTLSSPPSVSAAQLLVSINGVIQKPVAGTGQPSEGFSVSGNDIILGDAPETGADFFILTFRSLGVSEPADNSVTSAKIVDGAIVNADINASAAIAGTKINPSFTSDITISNSAPSIALIDTDSNSDFSIFGSQGEFRIRDQSNTTNRLTINSSGGVGIGTSNIDRRFHVEGTDNVMGKFQNNRGLCLIEFEDTDTTAGNRPSIGADANQLIFFTGGSTKGGIDVLGRLGIGTTDQGTFNQNADDIVISGSGNAGITIDTPNSNVGRIAFGDPEDNNVGQITYSHSSNLMSFDVNAASRMNIDSSGNVVVKTNDVALSGSGTLRINSGSTSGALNLDGGASNHGGEINLLGGSNGGRILFRTGVGSGQQSETMRLDENGNLGIGTTPASVLHVSSGNSGDCKLILEADTDNNDENDNPLIVFRQDGGIEESAIGMGFTSTASDNLLTIANSVTNGGISFATGTTNGYTNAVERIRIDTSGSLFIGATSYGGGGADPKLYVSGTSGRTMKIHGGSATSSLQLTNSTTGEGEDAGFQIAQSGNTAILANAEAQVVLIQNQQSVQGSTVLRVSKPQASSSVASHMIHFIVGSHERGAIAAGSSFGSSPSFTSISDYRVKTNIRNYTDGWNNIKALPVKIFDINKEGEEATDIKGWIAHEVQAVIPEAVTGTKDAKNEDGSDEYQSLGYGMFMPDVVNALQTAIAKIEALETKVAALEAK